MIPIWCNVKLSSFFFVLFSAVKIYTKLTLHHMWNIFIIQLTKIEFKSFLPLIFLGGWTSGFHAIDD